MEAVGEDVTTVRPGQFVIGSFVASDGTCPHCRAGYHASCMRREPVLGAQAELLRVPLADGTLVSTPDQPDAEPVPSLLTLSDVMGTGWFAAVTAGVGPGSTVASSRRTRSGSAACSPRGSWTSSRRATRFRTWSRNE